MTTTFVETNQFNQMISYIPIAETQKQKKEVKYSLLDRIKGSLGDKWGRLKEGTRQAFDMLCFLGSERGFVYASDKYLADRHDISDKTIRTRFKELEELGEVVKVYRRAKKCNGRGKPIYLFTNHPYFEYWAKLLGLNAANFNSNVHTDFQTENVEIPCESRDEEGKKMPTYLLPKKQEIYINNIGNQYKKLMQLVGFKILDYVKYGSKIGHPSSYIDSVLKDLAVVADKKAQKRQKEDSEEEKARLAWGIAMAKRNWLNKA